MGLFPEAGGLMSYGLDISNSYNHLGLYAAKILNGAMPADVPIQQIAKLENW
jgi:putative ABC transport system substrate-binding protein